MKKKIIAVIAVLSILIGVVAGAYVLLGGSDNSPGPVSEKPEDGPKMDDKQEGEDTPKVEVEDVEEAKGDITFLLMGVDDGERTDTLMVCKYFEKTGKIAVLSVPRDTRTLIPGYGLDKINHAHAYGGADLSLASINNLLDMDIEYHVRVDYKIVEEVVDVLGGIEVDVPSGIEGLDPGVQTLDGGQAELFLRHRKGYYNQDLGRIKAQQEFIKSLVAKMAETRNIVKISSMIKSSLDHVETNVPLSTALGYALKLRGLDISELQMETLPGTPGMINGISYIIVDQEEIPGVVERLFLNSDI